MNREINIYIYIHTPIFPVAILVLKSYSPQGQELALLGKPSLGSRRLYQAGLTGPAVACIKLGWPGILGQWSRKTSGI